MYVIITSVNRKKIDVDSARSAYSDDTPVLQLPDYIYIYIFLYKLKHLPPTMKSAPFCVQICVD